MELSELEKRALQICEVPDINGRSYRKICAKSIIYHELHSRGYTMCAISRMLSVDRLSVLNLLKKYDDRLKYDKEFKMLVERFNEYNK